MYRAYRSWVLHTWTLQGPPQSWHSQLAALYRQQPVFAVIGGLGNGSWEPVHDFCEALEVPCVFPDVDHPVVTTTGHYPLYFSRGVFLEAQALAKHLRETEAGDEVGTIVQVYRDTPLGRLPAHALRQALHGAHGPTVVDYPLAGAGPLPPAYLPALRGRPGPYVLVLWLGADDLQQLKLVGSPPPALRQIYLSASLSAMRQPDWPQGWLSLARMIYPFDLPHERDQRLARLKAWLGARKMALVEERAQANAFFAITVTGDALAHLGENFSRDYFIERIEQMTEASLSPSIYPRLSLGPGQRYASRGAYIVKFSLAAPSQAIPVTGWLVP